ncbi:STAS domain-containing protein [Olsenella intestinalis]|uniref:STAS domain-containing protein n=1 Tax=Olsenella intestinalis TaxID=2930083 RepID=UPI00200D4801|nr:STAS domain-containing protein [Olsenella intestinalis]
MDITSTTEGATTTIELDGWLDTSTAPELAEAIGQLDDSCERLVLDFAKLQYISSAGLRVLVSAHKKMNGELMIKSVSPDVMTVLHMAGFDKRLNIS